MWCGCTLSTILQWYLKGRLVGVSLVVPRNTSFELWLGIGVKHVTFLELWLGKATLEWWLGITDEYEELLSCGSSWRVLLVWVYELWLVWRVHIDFPPWYETTGLVVLGRYEWYSYWELDLALRSVVHSMVSRMCFARYGW